MLSDAEDMSVLEIFDHDSVTSPRQTVESRSDWPSSGMGQMAIVEETVSPLETNSTV